MRGNGAEGYDWEPLVVTQHMSVMLSEAKHLAFSSRYEDEILRLRLRMTFEAMMKCLS